MNTNEDWTKNTNADLAHDKVIMGGNPKNYYDGILEKMNFYGYYTNDSHMMCINEIEQCYMQKRFIFSTDDNTDRVCSHPYNSTSYYISFFNI